MKMPRRPASWDPSTARYRDPYTGRYITRSAVMGYVDDLVRASQGRITDLSEDLRRGSIDLGEWNAGMRREIKRIQLSTEALMRGGWNQLTPADYGRVGARIKKQYEYLNALTDRLRVGSLRTDGSFMNYARLYGAAGREAAHEAMTESVRLAGYTEERNVLHPAEHCLMCVDQSAAGYVPLGSLVPVGARTCLGNDKCTMRYR